MLDEMPVIKNLINQSSLYPENDESEDGSPKAKPSMDIRISSDLHSPVNKSSIVDVFVDAQLMQSVKVEPLVELVETVSE